jgi:hypothetical protein
MGVGDRVPYAFTRCMQQDLLLDAIGVHKQSLGNEVRMGAGKIAFACIFGCKFEACGRGPLRWCKRPGSSVLVLLRGTCQLKGLISGDIAI